MCETPRQTRLLLVEDDPLLLLDLQEFLAERGYAIAGRATSLSHGLALARTLDLDAAVLDVDLAGQSAEAIAHVLIGRQRPFLLLTAYSRGQLPPGLQDRPLLTKPFDAVKLDRTLSRLVACADAERKAAEGAAGQPCGCRTAAEPVAAGRVLVAA